MFNLGLWQVEFINRDGNDDAFIATAWNQEHILELLRQELQNAEGYKDEDTITIKSIQIVNQ